MTRAADLYCLFHAGTSKGNPGGGKAGRKFLRGVSGGKKNGPGQASPSRLKRRIRIFCDDGLRRRGEKKKEIARHVFDCEIMGERK